jgi:cell division protein FtsI/penicillin-binding protein 2
MHSGGAGPGASISGAPLEAEAARSQNITPRTDPPAVQHSPAILAPPMLALDRMERVGDHYEAPLGPGRAKLTLDPDLQAYAEKLLEEARAPRGAIVAMTPDGKILALAGRKTAQAKGGSNGTFDWQLATDAWGPAASIFKLVTASALVGGGVDPDDKVCYHGGLHAPTESTLRDSKRDSSCNTLAWGVAHSNNAILAKLAFQHLEPAALAQYAHDLFGDIPPSLAVPATFGELSLPEGKGLELAQAAAGFTGAKLSVLGGALLAATFANGGERPSPRLIDDTKPPAPPRRVIAQTIANAVAKMMVGTCRFGSAARSFGDRDLAVAGKTGTLTTTDPFYMEHSWFVGYAPADHPQIVVAVLLGNAENWRLRGHEAARRLIDRAVRRAEDRVREGPDRATTHRE